MAKLSEAVLYWLVKRFYRTEMAHSSQMKAALQSRDQFDAYRATRAEEVRAAAERYGVTLSGRDLLDLGCNDGAVTVCYPKYGVHKVVGVDVDAGAIAVAQQKRADSQVQFQVSSVAGLPLPDESVDLIVSYDVFEHLTKPAEILKECKRVLRPSGQMLILTWGWYHPFAPHLWATMPVPWAHVFFSERTIMRTCRRVFHSPWYVPNMHDLDEHGQKKADRYREECISPDHLNKLFVRDFEKLFQESGLASRVYLEPFRSRYARWTKVLTKIPYLREFFTSYLWAILEKRPESPRGR